MINLVAFSQPHSDAFWSLFVLRKAGLNVIRSFLRKSRFPSTEKTRIKAIRSLLVTGHRFCAGVLNHFRVLNFWGNSEFLSKKFYNIDHKMQKSRTRYY